MSLGILKSIFKGAMAPLEQSAWFKKNNWRYSVHEFPKSKPEGVTLHVFKPNWFNHEGQGIHIESYLSLDTKKHKKTYLTIHLLHGETVPGTKHMRMALSKPVVDAVFKEMSAWDGYVFRAGKYGTQPFTKYIDATTDTFETNLGREVTKLCKLFEKPIDKTLSSLLQKKGPTTSRGPK